MYDFTIKPCEWNSPTMQTDYARDIVSKLENYYGRPMIGKISLVEPKEEKPGIEIEYCDPDMVKQLIIKLNKLDREEKEREASVKELISVAKGHAYE